MIFRITQKFNKLIDAGSLATVPQIDDPFADWSVNFFDFGRHRYIIASNTKSLYTILFDGYGITSGGQFVERFAANLKPFMQDDGLEAAYRQLINPSLHQVTFAKSLNRSITGSMCQMIQYAMIFLEDGNESSYKLGFRLNDVIYSAIGEKPNDYGKPKEFLTSLISAALSSSQ